eukprot:1142866-Pelagomonas_calceolata.AAC.5
MQQHAAALPAPLSHALQPPSVAGQHWSNLPSASSMAPSNGAPGHQFIQSGMLPASAITHAPAAMGSLYGGSMTLDGGSSAVLTELVGMPLSPLKGPLLLVAALGLRRWCHPNALDDDDLHVNKNSLMQALAGSVQHMKQHNMAGKVCIIVNEELQPQSLTAATAMLTGRALQPGCHASNA